ncbi:SDR family NAD(P)-dependent oxidoreductase [Mesorhizobium sp. M9A.F.Ca.ET.002.03.1.2]|uniref:SDR family NAD(P)-dependent oxidoreductase n=1 Tax=Mesorhizobium sp. M9A.F.Ca.ET.002.03.1.2 TaxID=2493668 RepID=UPI000F75530A|nr:SDR family NAD(P)-dependent oxidoreductase [Mesorhizobium sp. M9A.F.Ca.ET.002.03.1.2]AZO00486.1 SDR family NAD(P)-dependent oxidoreductase [Mesorhizobium sp. M9A.F.Ca.ET.002.03.1.2]
MELKDKIVLITGSTDGVGRVVAERLGASGAHILVHGRDATRGKATVAAVEAAGGEAELFVADLSSLAEVRRLAEAVRAKSSRLDILINNAGIGTADQSARRQVSADGYELRFAVNYLAGFLLTSELLPLLKASAPARIVNVASAGQQAIDFSDVMLTRDYSGVRAYCQSKLAQILFTIDLAEQLKGTGVTVNSLHPASYMNTTMVRQAGVTPWSSVETGADAILNLATSPALEGRSGLYFDGLRESRADAQAYDEKARQQLRELSLDLVESLTSKEQHS